MEGGEAKNTVHGGGGGGGGLIRAGAVVGSVGCTLMIVGLHPVHPCSLCGVCPDMPFF